MLLDPGSVGNWAAVVGMPGFGALAAAEDCDIDLAPLRQFLGHPHLLQPTRSPDSATRHCT